jgi:arylsulfatase A-like enzyme
VANAAFHRLWAYRRDMGASRILRPLKHWIGAQGDPWFAVVHYLEAHLPYRPPRKWVARFASDPIQAERWRQADQWRAAWRHMAGVDLMSEADLAVWRDLYRAEVAYADFHLGLLMDWLQHSNRLEDTVVIVVADHGDNLGEHGLLNHQYCVYDTLLRVPLVIRHPSSLARGQRVAHQVQTLDLFKTILDLAGIEAPASASRNLFSEDERRSFVVAEYGAPRLPHPSDLHRFGLRGEDLDRFERGLVAVRTDSHKLIMGTDGTLELFAWNEDPDEEHNLAAARPEVVKELQMLLQRWQEEVEALPIRGGDDEPWEMDSTTAARLRGLGYIE